MLDQNTLIAESIDVIRDAMFVVPVLTADDLEQEFMGCVVPFVRPADPEDAKFTTREAA